MQPALRVFGGESATATPVEGGLSLQLPPSLEDTPVVAAGGVQRHSSAPASESTPKAANVPIATPQSSYEADTPRRRTALLTWGLNSSGQLGFGDFSTRILPRAVDYFKATRLAGVTCGSRTTFALDAEGKVFAWGKGEDGALGFGDRATAMTPRLVEALLRHPIKV